MRTMVIRIGAGLVALIALAISLVSINANASSASAHASKSGSTQAQPVAHAPYASYAPDCGPNWNVVPSPNSGPLYGVAAVSANDVWAVGGVNQTLVEHWDGTSWSVVPSPNVGSASTLKGVAAVSANDVWAVGEHYYNNGNYPQTLVEHWDGSTWSAVPSPNPGVRGNPLYGVAAVSANDVWAVGYYYNNDNRYQTLVEHWDGSTWSVVPSPSPDTLGNFLYGVAAVSANDVWAVGSYGFYGGFGRWTLVEHWDGTSWSVVPSPNVGYGNTLNGVAAVSANDVWAVGYYSNGGYWKTLVLHWDGSTWSAVPSPNPDPFPYHRELRGIAAVSANDVWAVGRQGGGTLVEHWDGTSWSVVPSLYSGILLGVAVVSANDVWAVGSGGLVERYNPCPASPTPTRTRTPTITPTRTRTNTPTITPTPTNTPTFTATFTPTNTPTSIPTSIPTNTPIITPTNTLAITPTRTPTSTSTTTRTPLPSDTPTWTPTAIGTPTATLTGTPPTTSIPTRTRTVTPPSTSTSTGTAAPPTTTRTSTPGAPTATPMPCTISFSDVHQSDYFHDAVIYLACHGAISGYSDGTFRPFNNTTRGQVTKIVILGFGIPIDTTGGPHFSDVPTNHPFYAYAETANHNGIVSGYSDGTFRPGNNVTRGQLSKIVVVAAVLVNGWTLINPPAPTFTDVLPASAFYQYVETAVSKGVIAGYSDHTFRPGNNATRGQIAKITYLAVITP